MRQHSVCGHLPKRRQLRRTRQASREVSNIVLHIRVPKFQVVKRAHLLYGLLRCPPVERDPVRSDEHPATISAQPAVQKYFPPGLLPNQREKTSDLFILRRCPAVSRQVDEPHAQGFRLLAFVLDQSVQFASEINDRVDVEFLKLLHRIAPRLPAAVQKIVYLPEISNPRHSDFLRESELPAGRRRVIPRAAARAGRGQRPHQQRSANAGSNHTELDARKFRTAVHYQISITLCQVSKECTR